MTNPSRGLEAEVGGALLAAAVVVIAVILIGPRTQIVPAIAIGSIIAVAEVVHSRSRARIESLTRLLGDRTAPAATDAPRPAAAPTRADVDPRGTAEPVSVPLGQFIPSDRRRDDPQCPACGRFLVDVAGSDPTHYRCRACDANWQAKRGDPWPDVAIVPDLRSPRHPPATS